ncbi:hypothetical protein OIU34_37210 [Pararhizobium sp. BT-229]|uniref:hypothetical protein n=1 Tax=Pararhizobium sp. BT-229 TaxID=2986923 RepID=UPI0021F7A20C|nr:hypothetical protein [Pararhizobium sp. BT-229]MCV9967473.1 hypothetical protein [Pararhizobium sp. BT-229]
MTATDCQAFMQHLIEKATGADNPIDGGIDIAEMRGRCRQVERRLEERRTARLANFFAGSGEAFLSADDLLDEIGRIPQAIEDGGTFKRATGYRR